MKGGSQNHKPKEAFADDINPNRTSVKDKFNLFCNETSFTALTRIHNAPSLQRRLAWLVILFSMLGWMTIQCYWLLEKYFNYPVEVKIDVISVQTIDFPSVTICNINPIKQGKLQNGAFENVTRYFQHKNEEEKLMYAKAMEEMQKSLIDNITDENYETVLGWFAASDSVTETNDNDNLLDQFLNFTNTTLLSDKNLSEPMGVIEPQPITTVSPDAEQSATSELKPVPPPLTTTTEYNDINKSTIDNISLSMEQMLELMGDDRDFSIWDALDNNDVASDFYATMGDSYNAAFKYAAVAAKLTPNDLEPYGHRVKDLVMSCTINGLSCSPRNFTYLKNTKYGNCYTFNANPNITISSKFPGPFMGLVLELNIEQNKYVSALAQDSGIRVTIHEKNTYPFPEDTGFSIAPGYSTSVGLRKRTINRLTPPHADCADSGQIEDVYATNFQTNYTKTTCLKSCYQQMIVDKCKCGYPYFFVADGINVCDMGNNNIQDCVDDTLMQVTSCDDKCPAPCHEVKYETRISMSEWPSEKYSDQFESEMQMRSSQFMDKDYMDDRDDNLAKLEVYFMELTYEDITQQKAYESQNLISDIGGQLGLWLGLSAITIGELFEFLMTLSRLITWKCCSRRDRNGIGPPVSDSMTRIIPLKNYS